MTKTASDKIASFASRLGQTAKSIVKLLTQRRRATITKADADTSRPLIILANGPSLNQTIAESLPSLQAHPTLAVNFAANAPNSARSARAITCSSTRIFSPRPTTLT